MSTSFKRVLAVGCFDGLHYGHIEHLDQAKCFGDMLIVAVTSDEKVRSEKGEPVFDEMQRVAMIRALRCVDAAFVNRINVAELLYAMKPDVYIKGPDWEWEISEEERTACKQTNTKIEFTRGKKYSSREIFKKEECAGAVWWEATLCAFRPKAIFKPRGVGEGDIGVE